MLPGAGGLIASLKGQPNKPLRFLSNSTSNGKIEVESVTLPYLQVGELRAESLPVVVQDLSSMKRRLGITIGAIAGLDILNSRSVMIDDWNRRMIFDG
jgi:hypothetical protein